MCYTFFVYKNCFFLSVSGVDSLSRRRKEGATLIKAKQFPKRSLLVNFLLLAETVVMNS